MTDKIPNGWRKTTLGDKEFFEIISSGVEPFDGKKHYLSTSSIIGSKIESIEMDVTYNDRPSRANMQPIEGSVWFAKMKETLKVLEVDRDIAKHYLLSTGYCGINPKGVVSGFLKQILLSDKFNSIKDSLSTGSTQQGIGNGDLNQIPILLPSENEQKRIAELLNTIDEDIEKTNQILKKCYSIKNGMIKSLISDPMNNSPDWKFKPFNDVFNSVRRPIKKLPNIKYKRVIVKRGRGGVILRDILEGSKIQVKSQFILKSGDIVISKRQIFHGAIGIVPDDLDESVVSNEYEAIKLKPGYDLQFLFYCTYTPEFMTTIKKRTQGIDKEKFRFLFESWLKTTGLNLPDLSLQKKIANSIYSVEQRINQEEIKLNNLVTIKKSLMQKLLSGEMRVKV